MTTRRPSTTTTTTSTTTMDEIKSSMKFGRSQQQRQQQEQLSPVSRREYVSCKGQMASAASTAGAGAGSVFVYTRPTSPILDSAATNTTDDAEKNSGFGGPEKRMMRCWPLLLLLLLGETLFTCQQFASHLSFDERSFVRSLARDLTPSSWAG